MTSFVVLFYLIVFTAETEAISFTAVIGHGYNILTGNPDGGLAAKGGVDPGILQNNQIFQITTRDDGGYQELAMSNQTGCTGVQHSYIIHNTASYRDNLFQDVSIPDTNPAELKAAAFSASGLYKEVQSQTEANENVLVDVETECRTGIITYKTDQAVADHFTVTRHFAAAVCGLPDNYDMKAYTDFLSHWGTHVITEVYTGKKEIKRYQMPKSTLFSLVSNTDPHLIKEAGPYKNSGSSVTLNTTAFYGSHAASSVSGKVFYTINIGSDVHTDVIGLQLTPLSEALSNKYWKVTNVYQDISNCDTVVSKLYIVSANMFRAYEDLRKVLSGTVPTAYQLQAPLVWPKGTYGLPKPATGCPTGDVAWRSGWVSQDTETSNNGNKFSNNIGSLQGVFNTNYIRTEFCMKTNSSKPEYGLYWAPGAYCILRKNGQCLSGFSSGQIFWDDSDSSNSNTHGGILPDGMFYKDTIIDYCCRSDGSASASINLPTEKPFALYKYGSKCQAVTGMRYEEIFVCYDTEDTDPFTDYQGTYPSAESECTLPGYVICLYSKNTVNPIVGK